jgi:hypothetical protein
MATAPNFSASPRCEIVQATTANTARDGSGTIVNVLTAGSSGSRIDRLDAQAIAASTSGMLRWFLHDGANSRLYFETNVVAITPSASVPAWRYTASREAANRELFPILLESGQSLRVATNNAETFNIVATGGDF